jgi:1-acyl-sn-glycerol-3-phosphate acyltransferase
MVGVFPEGTRSRDGVLRDGHAGAALLAIRTGVRILPVGVAGTHRQFATWLPRRNRIAIRIGQPFSLPVQPNGLDRAALRRGTDRMMEAIAALLPAEQRGRWNASA